MAYEFQEVADAQVVGALEAAESFLNHLSEDFEMPANEFVNAGRKDFRRFTPATDSDIVSGVLATNTVNNTEVTLTVKNRKIGYEVQPSQIFHPDNGAKNLQRMGEKVADGFGLSATEFVIDDLVGTAIDASLNETLTVGQANLFAANDDEQRENLTKLGAIISKVQANSGMDLSRMWILMTTEAFGNLTSYSQNTLGTTIQWKTDQGVPFWQGRIPIFGNDNAGDPLEWGPVLKDCAFIGSGDGYFFSWGKGDILNGGFHGYGDGLEKLIFRKVYAFGSGDDKQLGSLTNGAAV